MAFDFPNTPTIGTLYDTGTGVVYAWDGTAWVVTSVTRATARRPSLVFNGSMQVSQENGTTAVTASGAYPADQWLLGVTGITAQGQLIGSASTPFNSRYALSVGATVAKASLAASDTLYLQQPVEGMSTIVLKWGTAQAIPAIARFNAYADTPGTYTFAIRNYPATQSFVKALSLTTSWQTFVIPIPACTAGTWAIDNTLSAQVSLNAAIGSTFIAAADNVWAAGNFLGAPGQTNIAATANKFLYISDFALYADPDNTGLPPPWEAPDYATELARCMRYFEKQSAVLVVASINLNQRSWAASKRTTPALSFAPQSGSGATFNATQFNGWYQSAAHSAAAQGDMTGNARM
jgi:hypothetical protein